MNAPASAPATVQASRAPLPAPSPYIVADVDDMRAVALALDGPGNVGVAVGNMRVVLEHGQQRFATEGVPDSLRGTVRIPRRFGGGFLFWTETSLYRSQTFDGALTPIARMPSYIETVSFAPKAIFVRMNEGERCAVSLTGERVALDFPALASIEALDDGRALAFDSFGAAFSSVDAGGHWTDVTSQLRSSPQHIAAVKDELWLFDSQGGALGLEPGGRLSFVGDKKPPERVKVRPIDPRWQGGFSPLRTVFRSGAALDDQTSLLVDQGNLVRVDMRTGEIVSMVAGKIPSEASCEAIPTGSDILFACEKDGSSTLVVSHTTGSGDPVIEKTFAENGTFYASDDGGLAFNGACKPTTSAASPACVRQPDGSWTQYDLSGLRGNASFQSATALRWVPRADGHAIALVSEPSLAIYDPRSGARVPLREGESTSAIRRSEFQRQRSMNSFTVDRLWSQSPSGTLRGWAEMWSGGVFEITADGHTRAPYEFNRLTTSGPYALGQWKDGRLLQSTDHGATWTLVAGSPDSSEWTAAINCSSAGCDFGGFYRIGWPTTPPAETPMPIAPQASEVGHSAPVEILCRPSGAIASKVLEYTKDSPEDLGLGAVRLPLTCSRRGFYGDSGQPLFFRPSGTPPHRRWSFVAPFDPLGVIKTTAAMNEVFATTRASRVHDYLADESVRGRFPMTPFDPSRASDLALAFEGFLAQLRAPGRAGEATRPPVRLVAQPPNGMSNIVSGVVLNEKESAFLAITVSRSIREHVLSVGQNGTTELFDVAPGTPENGFSYRNPDVLAIGPDGNLAVIRTPIGNDPPSSMDPAMLWLNGQNPRVLAPWSTLTLANDDACRKDSGYRATLQTMHPWVRVASADVGDGREEDSPMLVRVKWNDKRVCLEGLEVRMPDVEVPVTTPHGTYPMSVGTWLVSLGNTFARIGIAEGIEWRQPLECSIVPR